MTLISYLGHLLASDRKSEIVNRKSPEAPVTYCGYMEGYFGENGHHLYNLTAPIPGHPARSTVSEQTLLDAGYSIPSSLPSTLNPQPSTH